MSNQTPKVTEIKGSCLHSFIQGNGNVGDRGEIFRLACVFTRSKSETPSISLIFSSRTLLTLPGWSDLYIIFPLMWLLSDLFSGLCGHRDLIPFSSFIIIVSHQYVVVRRIYCVSRTGNMRESRHMRIHAAFCIYGYIEHPATGDAFLSKYVELRKMPVAQ